MNLIVDKIVTGPFQENCFIVWNENQNEAILIDPGDEHQLIIDQIEEKNLTPIAILNTHAHLDHIGAVSKLKETYRRLPKATQTRLDRLLLRLQDVSDKAKGRMKG